MRKRIKKQAVQPQHKNQGSFPVTTLSNNSKVLKLVSHKHSSQNDLEVYSEYKAFPLLQNEGSKFVTATSIRRVPSEERSQKEQEDKS